MPGAEETRTKRPNDKTLDTVGMMLVISGVVIGMAVAWIQGLSRGLQIGLLAFALALVAVGLLLNLKFRRGESE